MSKNMETFSENLNLFFFNALFWLSLHYFDRLCIILTVVALFWPSLHYSDRLCIILTLFALFLPSLHYFDLLCRKLTVVAFFLPSLHHFDRLCVILTVFVLFWPSLCYFDCFCVIMTVFGLFWQKQTFLTSLYLWNLLKSELLQSEKTMLMGPFLNIYLSWYITKDKEQNKFVDLYFMICDILTT